MKSDVLGNILVNGVRSGGEAKDGGIMAGRLEDRMYSGLLLVVENDDSWHCVGNLDVLDLLVG